MIEDPRSVLDQMTAQTAQRKATVALAAGLTPVGMERAAPSPPAGPLDGPHKAPFPYDNPETIQQALREGLSLVGEIIAEMNHVGKGIVALADLYGLSEDAALVPTASPADIEREEAALVKESEAEADAKFAADYAAKQAAAQASVFGSNDDGGPAWVCPDHGESVAAISGRTKRAYRKCPACSLFEK